MEHEIETTTETETETQASPAEAVPALTSVDVPVPLLLAALACASSEQATRFYLCGVFVHAYEGSIRMVGTDGHRMLVASHRPRLDEDQGLAPWLESGVIVPAENLKPRLMMIGKSGMARLAFAAGSPRLILSDPNEESVFRLAPIDGTFPDYNAIIAGSTGAFEPGKTGAFEQIGFNAQYLKHVGEIAKALDSKAVSVYGRQKDQPSVFTFDNAANAVLYLMPHRVSEVMLPETAAILSPVIKGTLAALRAHQTRNEAAAEEATTEAAKKAALAKASTFEKRIRDIMERTSQLVALPAPAPEAPAVNGSEIEPQPEPEPEAETPPPAKANGHRPTASAEKPKQSFKAWLADVSAVIQEKAGVALDDLPDVPTRDWYDARLSVNKAARRAIAYAKNN